MYTFYYYLSRDLKPENMILDSLSGHLKLIDFGTAKNMKDTTLNGPAFVGTPEYMSPETIGNSKTCDYNVDLWALGCIIYQLLAGKTPFGQGSPYLTFLAVKKGRVTFPKFFSDTAKDIIQKLLQIQPTNRLGAGKDGLEALKGKYTILKTRILSTLHTPPLSLSLYIYIPI